MSTKAQRNNHFLLFFIHFSQFTHKQIRTGTRYGIMYQMSLVAQLFMGKRYGLLLRVLIFKKGYVTRGEYGQKKNKVYYLILTMLGQSMFG